MTGAKSDPDAPRITQQYRDRQSRMVYELKQGTSRFMLLASQSADPAAEWRFEAHAAQAPQLIVTGSWGKTRTEAFNAMRDLWIARGDSLGLLHVDWEKVAAALTAVRAI